MNQKSVQHKKRIAVVSRGTTQQRCDISSLKQLHMLAQRIAASIKGGDVIALRGELGSGKTAFVQHLSRALGVKGRVTSPTFVIMNVYEVKDTQARERGIRQLCHIDAYRMLSEKDLQSVGGQDFIGTEDTVTAIEWAERVEQMLPPQTLWISFIRPL